MPRQLRTGDPRPLGGEVTRAVWAALTGRPQAAAELASTAGIRTHGARVALARLRGAGAVVAVDGGYARADLAGDLDGIRDHCTDDDEVTHD